METLTIKELAPYLPYGLKGILTQDLRDDFCDCDWVDDINIFDKGSIWQYAGYADKDLSIPLGEGDFSGFLIRHGYTYTSVGNSIKPLLRPLSDLTKLINDDEKNVKYYRLLSTCYSESDLRNFMQSPTVQRFEDVQILLENHFDVFGLIEKGHAIDLNTIKETVK